MSTCTVCEQAFSIQKGESRCPNGDYHQVPIKTYYMDDAPADPGPFIQTPHGPIATGENRKHSRTILYNLVPEQRIVVDGQTSVVPGREVIFVRGIYATTNAEEQFYLDRRLARGALCTKERWEQVYLTDSQRLELDKLELEAKKQRVEQAEMSLLARTKAQQVPIKDKVPA